MKTQNSYWEKRLKEEADNRTKSEVIIQKEMKDLYDNVNLRVENEINGFLGRYAYGKDFSVSELRRAISKEDVKAYYTKAKEYVKDGDFSKRANSHMKAYNLTMRTNRLEYLKAMIDLELINGFNTEEGITNNVLNAYALNKFKEQSGILGLTIPTEKLMHAKVETLKNTPFKGKLWSDRLWDRQTLLGNEVKKIAEDLVLLGKNPTVHINKIRDLFNVNAYEARRLAVTEGAIIQTRVTQYNYSQNGIEEYKFIAESSACSKCSALHDNKYKVENMMPGDNASPMHPHCHCTEVPFVDRQNLIDSVSNYKIEGVKTRLLGSEIIKDITIKKEVYSALKKEYPFLEKSNVNLRKERLNHIIEGHSDIGDDIPKAIERVIERPMFVLIDSKNENTVMFITRDSVNDITVIVKISNTKKMENSIITSYRVSEKRLRRILKKNKLIYKIK